MAGWKCMCVNFQENQLSRKMIQKWFRRFEDAQTLISRQRERKLKTLGDVKLNLI